MGKLRKVLIMAGGTGGHVFPGLAIAKYLKEQGIEVAWLGTQKGMEANLVPKADIPLYFINISGIKGKGWKDLVMSPFRLAKGIFQAFKIIKNQKPDVVLGLGGFVSGPGGIASWLLRRPLIIHEQNAKPGLTNKCLSQLAAKVLEAFPGTFSPNSKVITTGNPIRTEIALLPSPEHRLNEKTLVSPIRPLHLLVLGGSLGAAAINKLVPKTLTQLAVEERPLVYHQSGDKHYEETTKLYSEEGILADIKPFITEMDKAYAWADIVLCRAGALTVSELCAAGLGAILIPFPFATDDHQTTNASFMAKHNAAWVIQQVDLTPEKLASLLKKLVTTRDLCSAMAKSAYKLRKIDAAERIFTICQEMSH